MNVALHLHNAARRYCMDRHAYWWGVYQKIVEAGNTGVGSDYSEQALKVFPRYNVLDAILTEIERFDSENLPEYSELLELMLIAGQIADSIFTEPPNSEIAAATIQEERDTFVYAIRALTPELTAAIPLLPYRRVLGASEVGSLRDRVKARWGGDGSRLYPLAERTDSSLEAFDESAFHTEFDARRLRSILASWGLKRVYELREYGDNNYLMSVDCWDPNGLHSIGMEGCRAIRVALHINGYEVG